MQHLCSFLNFTDVFLKSTNLFLSVLRRILGTFYDAFWEGFTTPFLNIA